MKKILIVDDKPQELVGLRQALARPGHTVLEANSGRQAMDVHRREKVDLIVMNFWMPGLAGEEVTRRIRADTSLRYVSILLFSDIAQAGIRERSLAAGGNDFVPKPFDVRTLQMRVLKLLDAAARKATKLFAQVEVSDSGPPIAPFTGRILNLSLSGLLLETDAALDIGRELSLTFFVPDTQTQAKVLAQVVRRAAGHYLRWGLRFTTLDPVGQQALAAYVARTGTHDIRERP